MTHDDADLRKRMLFLSGVLGVMAGVGAYLLYKAVQRDNFALVAVLLPMLIAAIPLVKSLRRLNEIRRTTKSSG